MPHLLDSQPVSHGKVALRNKPLYAVCAMLLFFSLFDGMVSYISPLKISQAGFSTTVLGLIFGSSSVVGGMFDFFLSKYLTNTNFRRTYLIMFGLAFIYPLLIWQASAVWLFLIAMAIWGMYFDLIGFGSYDFISRHSQPEEHSAHFGLFTIFRQLGVTLAPLLAGLAIGVSGIVNWRPIALMLIFLVIAFSFYWITVWFSNKQKREYIEEIPHKPLHFLQEIRLWNRVGRILIPPLILIMAFNIFDAFFWTLGPLVAESLHELQPFNGLFLTAYTLPFLFVGWFVGGITKRIGKKRTAFLSFLLGSLVLSGFTFIHTPLLILGDVLLAAFFIGFTLPAIDGAFADYISESSKVEREIAALSDFFTNIGYVIGPIMAGFLADQLGGPATFSLLGVGGAIVAIILLFVTPKKITVNVSIPRQ